jgi:molybdopterin-guanine dinucleotide biosynthesis protein A
MVPGKVTGFVLAGGLSSRMGEDKSLMLFRGKPLIIYAIEALSPLCEKVIISSNLLVYDFTGCDVWPDELTVQAPINGLYSCLKKSKTDWNFILTCDMPFTGSQLFAYLLEQAHDEDAVVPVHGQGLVEPLCGVYNRSALKVLEQRVQVGQYGILKLLQAFRCRYMKIGPDQEFYNKEMFSNLNSPADLDMRNDSKQVTLPSKYRKS